MKSTITILILALTLTNALKLEQSAFVELTENNPFGQAVLSMAELTLKNTEPTGQLQAIRDLLGDIQGELDTIQQTADANFQAGQATCSLNINQLETELATLKATQTDTQQEQDDLKAEREAKTNELTEKRNNLLQDEADLAEYKKQLEQENTVYDDQQNNFQEAIDACDEAISLLNQMVHQSTAVSFAQSGKMFIQLSQKFQDVKGILANLEEKTAPTAFIQPIIDVLTQLGTTNQINFEQVQEITSLISTLRDRLVAGQTQRQTAHVVNQDNLQTLIDDLTQQVTDHTKQINNFEKRIGGIQDGLSQKDRILGTADEMTLLKESLLTATKNDCTQQSESYTAANKIRDNSSALVQKLINYFEDQIVAAVNATSNPQDDA